MTKEQALQLTYRQELHAGECRTVVGPRGGTKTKTETWRVNGAVKTWKTRPEAFQVPLKYGYNGPYTYLTERNMDEFHLASECQPTVTVYEVIVGNIGTVYTGRDAKIARETMQEYIRQSKSGVGRAGNEPVTLLLNGEIFDEYVVETE